MLKLIYLCYLVTNIFSFKEQKDSTLYIWYFPNHSMYSNKNDENEYRIKSFYTIKGYSNFQTKLNEDKLNYQDKFTKAPKPYYSFVIMQNKFRIYNDRTISFEAYNFKKKPIRLDTITINPSFITKENSPIILVIPDSVSKKIRLIRTTHNFID